jgi:hypothetical protein
MTVRSTKSESFVYVLVRLKSLRTAASLYVEKLGKDALRLTIKNKQELCDALEALDIQPNINAANMFVPSSHGVDESMSTEEHRGGLNWAVSDILWEVFGASSVIIDQCELF